MLNVAMPYINYGFKKFYNIVAEQSHDGSRGLPVSSEAQRAQNLSQYILPRLDEQ
jgi:hypothetical protein